MIGAMGMHKNKSLPAAAAMNKLLQRISPALVMVAVLALAGCGGGGGDSSSPPPAPPAPSVPTMSLQQSTVDVTAPITDVFPKPATFAVDISNVAPGAQVWFQLTNVPNIVRDIDLGTTSSGISFTLTYRPASSLQPDTYRSVIAIAACLEQSCSAPIAGSGATVTINYTVTPPVGAYPSISASTSTVSAELLHTFAANKQLPTVSVSYAGLLEPPYVQTTLAADFLLDAHINYTSPLSLVSFLKDGSVVGRGRHQGTITLTACIDSTCTHQLAGSPMVINVDVNATDTIPLPNGNTLKLVALRHRGFVWSQARGKFYLAQPSATPGGNGSLVTYDPVSEITETLAALGTQPGPITISDDNEYVYVGDRRSPVIRRFALSTLATTTISLGSSADGQTHYPRDIRVTPGVPTRFAVALGDESQNASGNLVRVYDGITALPQEFSVAADLNAHAESICWNGSAQSLVGARLSSWGLQTNALGSIHEMSVSASGVALIETAHNITYGRSYEGQLQCDGGRVYTDEGKIYDPATNLVETLTGTSPRLMRVSPDIDAGKVFGLGLTDPVGAEITSYYQISSHDAASLNETAVVRLPIEVRGDMLQFMRWGQNGVALSAGAFAPFAGADNSFAPYLVLVSGPLVAQ